MTSAQNGTIVLVGKNRTYSIDFYSPDAASTQWTFSANGAAASTSPSTYRVAEDCVIYDISINTGTAASGAALSNNSGTINGGVIRYANQLNTLSNRQKLKIPLRAGDIISAVTF